MDEDSLNLGGDIQLVGFKQVDRASMVIVKKMVGNYVKKFGDLCEKFEGVKLTLKIVHPTEKSEKYEIHTILMNSGSPVVSEFTDRNLFVTLDKVLGKVESLLQK
jgi:hypothetical protein